MTLETAMCIVCNTRAAELTTSATNEEDADVVAVCFPCYLIIKEISQSETVLNLTSGSTDDPTAEKIVALQTMLMNAERRIHALELEVEYFKGTSKLFIEFRRTLVAILEMEKPPSKKTAEKERKETLRNWEKLQKKVKAHDQRKDALTRAEQLATSMDPDTMDEAVAEMRRREMENIRAAADIDRRLREAEG